MCIEYDGEQHFKEVKIFKNDLESYKIKDEIKNQFCASNNIKLLRISFIEFEKITEILKNNIN